MSAPLLIFVSSPYSADTFDEIEANVHRALDIGAELLLRGHQPFVPHLSHWWDLAITGAGGCVPYERWLSWCLSWVERCDALLYLAPSPGADRELARAEELGLTIFRSLEDVPAVTLTIKETNESHP